jgi:hypothetical protein
MPDLVDDSTLFRAVKHLVAQASVVQRFFLYTFFAISLEVVGDLGSFYFGFSYLEDQTVIGF